MDTVESLRAEILEIRERFHQLLARVPVAAYDRPSENPAWSIGQVLYHMSIAPRLLIADVRMITRQSGLAKFVIDVFPDRLFHLLNERLTRFGARKLSPEYLQSEYDRATETTLKALEQVKDVDFSMSLNYPDWDPMLSGVVTLEDLFHYVKRHFEAHEAEIEGLI